jgi:AraC-like DNA-binding protein
VRPGAAIGRIGTVSTLPVPEALRGWVDRIEVATYGPDRFPLVHAPDPATVLLWRTTADGQGDVLVMGPRTRARYPAPKELPVCVRWRLGAGAARALVGTSPDELVDQVVPLGELWGRDADPFAGPASPDRLTAALAARAQAARADALVRQASVELSRPQVRVAATARRMGVSERHLREVFTAAVGLSPKQFARLTRLRRILPDMRSGSLARLAGEAGYYDQSHMTAQFREFMHVTPRAFAEGRVPTAAC